MSDQDSIDSDELKRQQTQHEKRIMQLKYFETENENLMIENQDLSQTLKINKQIIKDLMISDKPDVELAFKTMQEENEYLVGRYESMKLERDRLNSQMLLQQQVITNTKDKELDIAEIYKEQICELKDNLERKEYLLQLSEQRSQTFEKLLINFSQKDPDVMRKIQDQNLILQDRRITNVATENIELQSTNQYLMQQNKLLRDQLETIIERLNQQPNINELAEEISIFQNKITNTGTTTATTVTESKNYEGLDQKLKQSRNEVRQLKKEIETLKESNENHIFINEKLNKALKRCETRNEQMSQKLKQLTNESVVLKKEFKNEDQFGGDLSSIYIKGDMIQDFNVADD